MIKSKRMTMRKITQQDFDTLAAFLQDDEVMYAWNGGFSKEGVQEFIDKNIARYEKDGCGFLLATEKDSGDVVGAIGLIYNPDINGKADWEAAYILRKEQWRKGFAKEGAVACINYALQQFGAKRVIVQMRSTNMASEAVAKSLGLTYLGEYTRIYLGEDMPHKLYVAEKECNV